MIEADKNGVVSKTEFTQGFEELFEKHGIDPSKDLSFNVNSTCFGTHLKKAETSKSHSQTL